MKGRKKKVSRIIGMVALSVTLGSTVYGAEKTFTDVQPSDWYYEAVMSLAEKGIVSGYSNQLFKPNVFMHLIRTIQILMSGNIQIVL